MGFRMGPIELFHLSALDVSHPVIDVSLGFICQRVMVAIVNLASEIAQQGIDSPQDINQAVQLGLGYPHVPLAWGDELGAKRLLNILRMMGTSYDPLCRPIPWLRRRAGLGYSLLFVKRYS